MNGSFKIFEDTALQARDDARDCSGMDPPHSYRILVAALHIFLQCFRQFSEWVEIIPVHSWHRL